MEGEDSRLGRDKLMRNASTPSMTPPSSTYTAVSQPKPKSKRNRFAKYLPTDFMASLVRHDSPEELDDSQKEPKGTPPLAVCSDGTSQGFFAYEMENNRLLTLLQQNISAYADFILSLIEQQGILLIPQNVSMQNFDLSPQFLNTHAITIVAQSVEGTIFKTFNGILGSLDAKRENISILDLGEFSNTQPIESCPFSNTCVSPSGHKVPRLQILREGQLYFSVPTASTDTNVSPVGIILISDVFWAHKDDWIGDANSRSEGETNTNGKEDKETKESKEIAQYQAVYREKIMHVKAKKLRENIKIFLSNAKKRLPTDDYANDCAQINEFIDQVVASIQVNPLWLNATNQEISVARNHITKTILSQLYEIIFAPNELKKSDQNLHQIIDKLWFITPDNLDIQCNEWDLAVWEKAKNFLLRMNTVVTPKEKLLCVLNCSKTIIFMINSKGGVAGADDFLPHMIFAVILANPPLIQSNIEYIRSFCSNAPEDDLGESFYYLTILESAVYFLMNINPSSLGLSDDVLQKYMNGEILRTDRVMINVTTTPKVERKENSSTATTTTSPSLRPTASAPNILDISIELVDEPCSIEAEPSNNSEHKSNENNLHEVPVPEPVFVELNDNQSSQEVFNEKTNNNLQAANEQISFSANDFDFLANMTTPRRPSETNLKKSSVPTVAPMMQSTAEIQEKLQIMELTVSSIAESIQETPLTYTNANFESLTPSDFRLLLEEYKHMAAMLELVSSLKE